MTTVPLTARADQAGAPAGAENRAKEYNAYLERIAWALFLVVLGSVMLLERFGLHDGFLGLGVGLILLGLNAARYRAGLPISWFTTVVGLIALSAGLGDITGWDVPLLPIILIVVGTGMIVRHTARQREAHAGPFEEA